MGLRASKTGSVILDDCEVPEENLLGGEVEAQQPELAHATPEGARDLPRLLPRGDVRGDLPLDEGAYGAAQEVVLRGEDRGRHGA